MMCVSFCRQEIHTTLCDVWLWRWIRLDWCDDYLPTCTVCRTCSPRSCKIAAIFVWMAGIQRGWSSSPTTYLTPPWHMIRVWADNLCKWTLRHAIANGTQLSDRVRLILWFVGHESDYYYLTALCIIWRKCIRRFYLCQLTPQPSDTLLSR